MQWVKIIGFSIVLCCTLYMPCVEAKAVVGWTNQVFIIADNQTNHLLKEPNETEDQSTYMQMCKSISEAVSDKLIKLDQMGKLPFQLKRTNTEMNAQFTSDMPINLLPIIVLDKSFDSVYRIKDHVYYKSVIFSGIDLLFCCPDDETKSWRILGTLPLRYYGVLGQEQLLTQPISETDKVQAFLQITKDGIAGIKDFKGEQEIIKDLENRSVTPDTYQVTDVKISSQKAQNIFGNDQESLKTLIAGIFTSSYQCNTQRVVYPANVNGGWKDEVSSNLYSLQLNSPSGSVQMTIPKPKHEMQLELTGIGKGEIKLKEESAVQQTIGYKVWLKKVPTEGAEQSEVTKSEIKQLSKVNTAAIMFDDKDVFMELVIGAAKDLGNQKL